MHVKRETQPMNTTVNRTSSPVGPQVSKMRQKCPPPERDHRWAGARRKVRDADGLVRQWWWVGRGWRGWELHLNTTDGCLRGPMEEQKLEMAEVSEVWQWDQIRQGIKKNIRGMDNELCLGRTDLRCPRNAVVDHKLQLNRVKFTVTLNYSYKKYINLFFTGILNESWTVARQKEGIIKYGIMDEAHAGTWQ